MSAQILFPQFNQKNYNKSGLIAESRAICYLLAGGIRMKKYIIIIMLIFIATGCEKGGGVMEKKVADTDVKKKETFAKH